MGSTFQVSEYEKKELTALMYILCDQEISEIIEAVDLDGDGQINFEEYQELNAMMNYRLYQAMRTLMDQRFVKFRNLIVH
jgi:hypothetical protein